ncbi:MAG: CpsB/CapC family capsule biosynthesis tyrosine phosphatase [Lysinibacillus sp.]
MIDMHSHILYNVDDGSQSLNETMSMLMAAVDEGITEISATSHSFHPQFDVKRSEIDRQVLLLNEELTNRQIGLTIHRGQEIRLIEDLLAKLQNNEAITLANSKYLLLELPSNTVPPYTKHIILALQQVGIIPIIAHAERNLAIAERPSKLEELVRNGAMAQVTAGSLAGHFGKETQRLSVDLVKANLIHNYGSDVHNLRNCPFLFSAGLMYLEKHKLLDAVDILLENNARIIENKNFVVYEPEPIEKKWWKVF